MSKTDAPSCRLCLVTPLVSAPEAFARILEAALGGGDIASVIITANPTDPGALQRVAEVLVPIAQAHDAAALVHNDTRVAGRVKADGVHIDSGADDLKEAIRAMRPRFIVGAGDLRSRHDALTAGDAEPDYAFFGRLDGDTGDAIFPKALDLAAWWSELVTIPAIVMGGRAIESVVAARDAGIEFVALRSAIWDAADGARAAVAAAERLLQQAPEVVP